MKHVFLPILVWLLLSINWWMKFNIPTEIRTLYVFPYSILCYRFIDILMYIYVIHAHVWLSFDKRSKTILKIGTTKSQELIFANLFCTSLSKTQRNYEKKNFLLQSHPWPETVHHRSKASSRLVSPMSASPRLRSTPMPICGRFVTLLVVICTRSKLIIGQKKIGWNLTHGVKPTIFPIFLCPRDGRSGAYCFCPVNHSVIPSFRNSVILFETLTLPIIFQP